MKEEESERDKAGKTQHFSSIVIIYHYIYSILIRMYIWETMSHKIWSTNIDRLISLIGLSWAILRVLLIYICM